MKHSKSLKHPDRKPHRLGLPTLPELLEVMAEQARPLRMDRLLMVLGLARRDRHDLESLLTTLRTRGQVLRLRGGSWIRSEQLQHITGRFTALREGGGFVTPLKTDTEKKNWHRHTSLYQTDIYISAWRTGEAWHQDLVRVALSPGPTRGRSPEGHIVEVLERTLREVPALADRHTGRTLYCRP
ncbi:MAG: ribonuclease R, partial [Desulfovibrio sp.]|nr:ribonuclease R [Desulfovibrio sp.]